MTGANSPDQIPIEFSQKPNYDLSRFEVGESNRAAFKAVMAWPDWPSPILLLVGPKGSGKTHLGHGWTYKHGGAIIDAANAVSKADQPVFLDNANEMIESDLFTVMNLALNRKIPGLLLAARTFPQGWGVSLPDLRSRLYNTPTAELSGAEDDILEPIIRKLFEDVGREIRSDVVAYLMKYEDRSIHNMRRLIAQLDLAARQSKKDLTKAFTSRYLKSR